MSAIMKLYLVTICLFLSGDTIITAKNLDKSKNVKSGDVWLPRLLGTFHLKDAGFVEVYPITDSVAKDKNATDYADRYNLYITTFNAGISQRIYPFIAFHHISSLFNFIET